MSHSPRPSHYILRHESFVWLWRFTHHALRMKDGEHKRWHAWVAGAVSSLGSLAETRGNRLALGQQLTVRWVIDIASRKLPSHTTFQVVFRVCIDRARLGTGSVSPMVSFSSSDWHVDRSCMRGSCHRILYRKHTMIGGSFYREHVSPSHQCLRLGYNTLQKSPQRLSQCTGSSSERAGTMQRRP